MCGIFGFYLKKAVPVDSIFHVLELLEVHKFQKEPTPVGGFGAGLAVLESDGGIISEKVGKPDIDSPVKILAAKVKARGIKDASVLLSHVRMPSPEFMSTARFKETAQPYVVEFSPELTVASAHNGRVDNYKEIRTKLGPTHTFESEKSGLIDSEVVPHIFELLLNENDTVDDALYALLSTLRGQNSLALLHAGEEDYYLHILHRGKTRGMSVWTNDRSEVIFCSRTGPLMEAFKDVLSNGKFKEKAWIAWKEDAGLKLSFPIAL